MKNVSDKCCRETLNTHFISHNFFSENRIIYVIVGKCFRARQPRMTNILHAHFTLETKGDRYTHTGFEILISFHHNPRALMLRYTYIACLVDLID